MFGQKHRYVLRMIESEGACRRDSYALLMERHHQLIRQLCALYKHLGIEPKELSGITFVKKKPAPQAEAKPLSPEAEALLDRADSVEVD